MPPTTFTLPMIGFALARNAARRTWLMLAMVAMVPVWAAMRVMPGFLTAGSTTPLSDGAPNLWALAQALPWVGDLPLAGLAMATTVGAGAWIAARFAARPPRGEELAVAALLIALALPGLLPHMNAQDFLLAVMLSVILSLRQRNPLIAMLVSAGFLLATAGFAAIGALPMIAATVLTARPFFASPANDNGLPINLGMPYPA